MQLPNEKCSACGCEYFTHVTMVKKVSKIQTTVGQDMNLFIDGLACKDCGTLLGSEVKAA